MSLSRQDILKNLRKSIRINKPVIGVSVGAGISAKYAAMGGADLILTLNAGRFRQMGFSSLAGMMPFENSNKMVLEFGTKEVIRVVRDIPVVFGLCASDPGIETGNFIEKIHTLGFSGLNNFPTVGIIDGSFRAALEAECLGYEHEINAINMARKKNIFTVAFVFDGVQAMKMADAGADIICAHLGFTRGGVLGVKSYLPLKEAANQAQEIFNAVNRIDGNIIKLVYGGPVKTPKDAEYLYNNTDAMGYIGGSSFERIPTEEAIIHVTEAFKDYYALNTDNSSRNAEGRISYVDLIKSHISMHYSESIVLSRIAEEIHISRNYLSYLFRKEAGCTFEYYLMKYRIRKAKELMSWEDTSLSNIAEKVGFSDSAHFSKVFKKMTGQSPSEYIKEVCQ